MVSTKKGRLFRRKDGKYLIYVPKALADDSMFPFKTEKTLFVDISFIPRGRKELIVRPWIEEPSEGD